MLRRLRRVLLRSATQIGGGRLPASRPAHGRHSPVGLPRKALCRLLRLGPGRLQHRRCRLREPQQAAAVHGTPCLCRMRSAGEAPSQAPPAGHALLP